MGDESDHEMRTLLVENGRIGQGRAGQGRKSNDAKLSGA